MKVIIYVLLVLLNPILLMSQNLEVEGGLATNSIDVNNGRVKNILNPTASQDLANKAYTDSVVIALEVELGFKAQDVDGNIYNIVKIGNQVWMLENLQTTKFNDGTPLALVTNQSAWTSLTTPAYCYYNNDPSNEDAYGALYNFYVADSGNSMNVCPEEWHVPTDAEWLEMVNYLGGFNPSGGKMKEAGLSHWVAPNTGATNSSGFTGRPGGGRASNGSYDFFPLGLFGKFWSATEHSFLAGAAFSYELFTSTPTLTRNTSASKTEGVSIRCIKD